MNSQIFPSNEAIQSSKVQQFGLHGCHSNAIQWLSAILLIAAVVLFPERPAWGGGVEIESGPAGIKGVAHQAKLSEVLEILAYETGYAVYLDKALSQTKVSFNIPHTVPAERAIQIMVHPHSHALVYARTSDPLRLQIDQIKVYYGDPNASASKASDTSTETASEDNDPAEQQLIALQIAYADD